MSSALLQPQIFVLKQASPSSLNHCIINFAFFRLPQFLSHKLLHPPENIQDAFRSHPHPVLLFSLRIPIIYHYFYISSYSSHSPHFISILQRSRLLLGSLSSPWPYVYLPLNNPPITFSFNTSHPTLLISTSTYTNEGSIEQLPPWAAVDWRFFTWAGLGGISSLDDRSAARGQTPHCDLTSGGLKPTVDLTSLWIWLIIFSCIQSV